MYMRKIMDSCQKKSKGPKMYNSPATLTDPEKKDTYREGGKKPILTDAQKEKRRQNEQNRDPSSSSLRVPSPAQFNQGLVNAALDGKLNPKFKAKVMASDAAKKEKSSALTKKKKGLLSHLNKPGVVTNDPNYGKKPGNKGGIKKHCYKK